MRKILFLMATLSILMFTSCSSGSDEEDNDNNLKFIQVKVTSEDTPTPNGNIYLFKVNGYNIESDSPNSSAIDYTPVLFYKYNGEDKLMIPISEYGKKYKGELLLNEEEGYSVHSIYWYEPSSLYGTPKPGDEYLLFIQLRNGTYAKSSKRFIITKNSLITVKLPTCKDKSEFVDAVWTISDYEK